MRAFIRLPVEERRVYFEQAASRLGLRAESIEKDFWICWALRVLFTLPAWAGHLTFKGDTSRRPGIRRPRRPGTGAEPKAATEAPRGPQDRVPGPISCKPTRRLNTL